MILRSHILHRSMISQSEADAAYEAVRNDDLEDGAESEARLAEEREDALLSLVRNKAKARSNKSSAAILSLPAKNRT